MKLSVKWIGILIFASAIASLALFLSFDFMPCKNKVLAEVPSPNGKLVATIFERDCGATTAKNVQICLRPSSQAFSQKKYQSFLVYQGGNLTPALWWPNDDQLVVRMSEEANVFRQETEMKGVRIEYLQPQPQTNLASLHDYEFSKTNTNEVTALQPYEGIRLDSATISNLTKQRNLSASDAMKLAWHFHMVENDPTNAIKYFEIAASQGDATAAYNLGQIYLIVPAVANLAKARLEFERAVQLGDKRAADKLRELRH